MRAEIWRPLIRRTRLERVMRQWAEDMERRGQVREAFAFRQFAENLRMGVSLGTTDEQLAAVLRNPGSSNE